MKIFHLLKLEELKKINHLLQKKLKLYEEEKQLHHKSTC